MSEPFDTAKGAFYLVAIIIVTQMLASLGTVSGCIYLRITNPEMQEVCKSAIQPMLELFQMSFTAAIAFAGGRMSAPKPPEYKMPEEKDHGKS